MKEEVRSGEMLWARISFSPEQLALPNFEQYLDITLRRLREDFLRKRRDAGYEVPEAMRGLDDL